MDLEKFKEFREDKELSQTDIANILKVDQSAYSKWETGYEIIPLDKLYILSNHYKLSFDFIVGLNKINEYSEIKELNPTIIGNRLRELRTNNNLTIRDLAKIVNTTPSTISAYETGKVLILTVFAYEIAQKLNVSLDWICGK